MGHWYEVGSLKKMENVARLHNNQKIGGAVRI
jgi:hypothetical protein